MEAKAVAKGVRIAPRKARLVIDLIRGKDVVEADTILANINKEASRLIRKVLTSATANCENNLELKRENLYVKEAYINEGRTLKRDTKKQNTHGICKFSICRKCIYRRHK